MMAANHPAGVRSDESEATFGSDEGESRTSILLITFNMHISHPSAASSHSCPKITH
jgi:hypothetical protein